MITTPTGPPTLGDHVICLMTPYSSSLDLSRKRPQRWIEGSQRKSEVPANIVAAALHRRFLAENGLTNGGSISIGGIVKIWNWRDVACKVSSAKRGGNWCFCSSSKNQRRYQLSLRWKVRLPSLSSFPLQILTPEILQQCWDFTFSLLKCVSKIGCQIFTNNEHSQKT